MPKLTFLPHEVICPEGAEIEADEGQTILNAALSGGVVAERACPDVRVLAVGDDIRHRWVIARVPVGRSKGVSNLPMCE